jgi:feruloyl esterase
MVQITVVKKIYSGPVDDLGKYYYPGGQVYGSELGWVDWVVSPQDDNITLGKSIADSFVGYLSMPLDKQDTYLGALDVQFTPKAFDSIRAMASVYDATNPDLSNFQERGGKFILYHGFSDPSIVPSGTIAYYSAVVKQMGGLDTTQKFVRLFMFPGVYHCGGGYGPNHFDMVNAITAWVEHGIPPDKIIAYQYKSDDGEQSNNTDIKGSTFDNNGNFITMWGSEGTGDNQFIEPTSVAVDSQDNIYVVDMGAQKIKVFGFSPPQ